MPESRRVIYRFIGWFFLVNVLLASLFVFSYANVAPGFHLMGWIFFIAAFITQMALLFFTCCILIVGVMTLIPRLSIARLLSVLLSILFSVILIFLLAADRIVYSMYHMHYGALGLEVIQSGAFSQVIPLSVHEWLFVGGIFFVLFIIESVIAWVVWRQVRKQKNSRWGYGWAIFFSAIFFVVFGLNYWATHSSSLKPSARHTVLSAARLVPYFNELYTFLMPDNKATQYWQTAEGTVAIQARYAQHPLAYPLHPLHCKQPKQPLNILMIGIDTWRYDAMNSVVSPHIEQFAQKTLQFQNHWSGGNCTESGLFSLFYGLPANYWQAVVHQHQGAAFIHQLIRAHYDMGIFASAPLNFPAFDRTIFAEIKNLTLYTKGESTIVRDQAITQAFKNFLVTRDQSRPFFSFLFYDAAHNYCESVTPTQHPFQPWVRSCNRFSLTKNTDPLPYLNRYRNAVYFVDTEVNQVLSALRQQHLLKNTIVILTADHGEEINDHRSGYWEHASAYTDYQLHVPLLIYWPGKVPHIYTHFTTHYDVVPTIMTHVLGCQNPLTDYTIGQSLFTPGGRPILIAGSYADYAVLTDTQVVRIYPGGDYVIQDKHGQLLPGSTLHKAPLAKAFDYLNRYFRGHAS